MTSKKRILSSRLLATSVTALAALGLATPASALNIVLRADESFTASPNGAAALFGFQKAANYWNKTITTNATLIFDVHFAELGENILGGAFSNALDTSTADVYAGLAATSTSALDAVAVANLKPLSAAGGLGMRVPAPFAPDGTGLTTTPASVFDNDDSYNNLNLYTNTAVNKALGLGFDSADTIFAFYADNDILDVNADADADITFSSTFDFDFDPTDGITTGAFDFTAVALHEMGHALGFVSGVDDYDAVSFPNGPSREFLLGVDAGDIAWGSVLDLYRYATNGFDPDGDRQLQWDPGRGAFFSITGELPFNFDNQADAEYADFSTGRFNGDGQQASHWKDASPILLPNGCVLTNRQIGIMDPTAQTCGTGIVTSNDLAAFDAMGYTIDVSLRGDTGYTATTAKAFALPGLAIAQVPEPSTWAMLILGFGFVGAGVRRAKVRTAIVTA